MRIAAKCKPGLVARCLALIFASASWTSGAAAATETVVYPAPAGERLSKDYEVWVEGKKVDVYVARVLDPPFAGKEWDFGGPYSFANFDAAGRVTVRIVSARPMRDATFRNLDVLHFAMPPLLLQPGEDMRLENVRVEDVRMHGEGQDELIWLQPVVNRYMRKKTPGFISDIHFKNISVDGKEGRYRVRLAGADVEHNVRNVSFENVSILGTPLLKSSPRVTIGPHVEQVSFTISRDVVQPPCYRAGSEFKTPNLDQLAREGMRFSELSNSKIFPPLKYQPLSWSSHQNTSATN